MSLYWNFFVQYLKSNLSPSSFITVNTIFLLRYEILLTNILLSNLRKMRYNEICKGFPFSLKDIPVSSKASSKITSLSFFYQNIIDKWVVTPIWYLNKTRDVKINSKKIKASNKARSSVLNNLDFTKFRGWFRQIANSACLIHQNFIKIQSKNAQGQD